MTKNYCIEDVACFLSVTVSLASMLSDKYFWADKNSVCTKDVQSALHCVNAHASNIIVNYELISHSLVILEDRITQAAEMLDSIASRELQTCKHHLSGERNLQTQSKGEI